MPVDVNGVQYWTSTEAAKRVGVSRQTVWRWRKMKAIPAGNRYRNGQVLFSERELAKIEEYAHRLEPLDDGLRNQPSLF